MYNKNKKDQLDWSHLAQDLPFKTRYSKDKIKLKLKGTEKRKGKREQLLDNLKENEEMLEFERESTRSQSVENWLWGEGYGPVVRHTT
jgi:hypothetical protein